MTHLLLLALLACTGAEPAPPTAASAPPTTEPAAAAPSPASSPAPPPAAPLPPPRETLIGTDVAGITVKSLQLRRRPLPNVEAREALAAEYWRTHYGEPPEPLRITPKVVVLHWTAGPTAESAFNTFAPAELGGRPELGGGVNVGAHFLVHQDGLVEQLMPETSMARHVIGLNHVAIGIENVGGPELPLTEAQAQADAALVRMLTQRFAITHLIGHMEYQAFEGHPYWAEKDPNYRTSKPDPGADFMAQVRALVEDLGLEGPPPS